MKVIELKRKIFNGGPLVDTSEDSMFEWWCIIETKEEEIVYEAFLKEGNSNIQNEDIINLWNKMVVHAGKGLGVCWGNDDIYGYIRPGENAPKEGLDFTDYNGDVWEIA